MGSPAGSQKHNNNTVNVLVLGAGIAGLSTALKFADRAQVTLICKSDPLEGATRYAQGGIASVWSKDDSFEEHKQDTLDAGGSLCDERIVELCVQEGPERVAELIDWGVRFTGSKDRADNGYDLHREGGHRKRRILHADDLTGKAIQESLLERAREHANIKILDHHVVIDLITDAKLADAKTGEAKKCLGVYVLDSERDTVVALSADVTVLATGGAGKAYLYTSNPDTSTGDGIAMAYRAGVRVANMEFMQFHPTCLYHPQTKTYLISEALRGEGAQLVNLRGESFTEKYHPMGDLAPRDVVARAIDMEMKKSGDTHVYLDARSIGADLLVKKFPNIFDICQSCGIDIRTDMIPVVPAAHYTCGGVVVDEYGETSLPGLFAVGEVSSSGLHGANRLASNSLLEAVVFAHRVAERALERVEQAERRGELPGPLPEWDTGQAVALEEQIDIAATWREIRTLMWNYVGIVRSDSRLKRAQRRLDLLRNEVEDYYWKFLLTKDLIELRDLMTVSELIVHCASQRKESRGLHYNIDHPERDDRFFKKNTVI